MDSETKTVLVSNRIIVARVMDSSDYTTRTTVDLETATTETAIVKETATKRTTKGTAIVITAVVVVEIGNIISIFVGFAIRFGSIGNIKVVNETNPSILN